MSRGFLATAFLAAASLAVVRPADARPQYQKGFAEEYPALEAETLRVRCDACHCSKDRKARNDYGAALHKALKVKNVKRPDVVRQAMREVEKEPSAVEGKTFGDLIDEGRLPGTCPEPEKQWSRRRGTQ